MAVAIPIAMYVSAGIAAYSAIQQGKAASAAAHFNAMTQKSEAAQSRSEALAQSIQQQRETVLRLGAARAAAGATGGTGEGSALDLIGDIASQGELERQWIIYQGESRARGFERTAELDIMQGRAAMDAGIARGAGAALDLGAGAYQAQGRLRAS